MTLPSAPLYRVVICFYSSPFILHIHACHHCKTAWTSGTHGHQHQSCPTSLTAPSALFAFRTTGIAYKSFHITHRRRRVLWSTWTLVATWRSRRRSFDKFTPTSCRFRSNQSNASWAIFVRQMVASGQRKLLTQFRASHRASFFKHKLLATPKMTCPKSICLLQLPRM